jgi:hypothetical protein
MYKNKNRATQIQAELPSPSAELMLEYTKQHTTTVLQSWQACWSFALSKTG